MSEPQLVHREEQDGVTILSFGGSLSSIHEDVIKTISDELLSVTPAPPARVVVDLSGIEFFGSSFIEVLFRLWHRIQGGGGKFALCNVSPYCREVLTVTNLDTLWPNHPSRDAAVAELQAQS